jgi:tRNA(Ile)-lysidine synthase
LIKLILNYLALEMETTSYDRIEEIRAASADQERTAWSADIGSRIRFAREGNTLLWQRTDITCARSSGEYECLVEQADELLYVPQTGDSIDFSVLAPEDAAKPIGKGEALFDLDQIRFPLTVRCRRPGDRMAVQGLNGTKKVQDMFVDAKVPRSRRDKLPLLVDGKGRLLWIPGMRRSSHALVTADTRKTLRITLERSESIIF